MEEKIEFATSENQNKSTWVCPLCGAEVDDDLDICPVCGYKKE